MNSAQGYVERENKKEEIREKIGVLEEEKASILTTEQIEAENKNLPRGETVDPSIGSYAKEEHERIDKEIEVHKKSIDDLNRGAGVLIGDSKAGNI